MFHTSLLTKNLLFCLVVFSFSWGFSMVNLPNNVSACTIDEEDEDDPEEDEDESPSAELVERQYRRQWGALMSDWATEIGGRNHTTNAYFVRKIIDGTAKLETVCKAKCTVPPGHFKLFFKIYVKVFDHNGNEMLAHRAESAWKDLLDGETFVNGPQVSVPGYTEDSLTVVYRVVMKQEFGQEMEMDWWMIKFRKLP